MSRQGRKGRTIAAAVAVAVVGAFASGGPLDELLPRPRSVVPKDGVVMHGVPVKVERKAVECANPLTADEASRLTISSDEITIEGLKPGMCAKITMWVDASGLSEGGVPEASLAWGSRAPLLCDPRAGDEEPEHQQLRRSRHP